MTKALLGGAALVALVSGTARAASIQVGPGETFTLTDDGRYRYTYHRIGSLRIELCAGRARAGFERWATTGSAAGVSDEFLQRAATEPA